MYSTNGIEVDVSIHIDNADDDDDGIKEEYISAHKRSSRPSIGDIPGLFVQTLPPHLVAGLILTMWNGRQAPAWMNFLQLVYAFL